MAKHLLPPPGHARGIAEALISDNALVDVLAFVTVHVREAIHSRATPAFVLSQFRYSYEKLSRDLLGSNFHRPLKRAQAPRALVAFDRQGSRHQATRPDQLTLGPHAHAVIALAPEYYRIPEGDLDGAIRSSILKAEAFDTAHVRLVPYHFDTLVRLVDYSTKDARYLEASGKWPDIAYDIIAPAPYRHSTDVTRRATELA